MGGDTSELLSAVARAQLSLSHSSYEMKIKRTSWQVAQRPQPKAGQKPQRHPARTLQRAPSKQRRVLRQPLPESFTCPKTKSRKPTGNTRSGPRPEFVHRQIWRKHANQREGRIE